MKCRHHIEGEGTVETLRSALFTVHQGLTDLVAVGIGRGLEYYVLL